MFSFDFIIDGTRESPLHVSEFNGYFRGACRVVRCDSKPTWVGQLRTLTLFNLVSLSTAFIYRVHRASIKGHLIEVPAGDAVISIGMRNTLGQRDLVHMYEEIWGSSSSPPKKHKKLEEGEDDEGTNVPSAFEWRLALDKLTNFVPETLAEHPEFHALLMERSDVLRLQYIQPLCLYFVKEKGTLSEEQRDKIRSLTTEQLQVFVHRLKTQPWLLAFRETADPLDPLVKAQYERACVAFKVDVPRHVQLSMQVYYLCMKQMVDDGHTCFQWTKEARKCLNLLEYSTMEPLVMQFLEEHAITWLDVAHTTFALKREYSDAKMVCQALMRTAQNATRTAPLLRGPRVPIYPPDLTQDQLHIAQHIGNHYLTVVEGLPGTGKTKLIEWVFCRFQNVLLCTLTGMMTKSLRTRLGNRPESAYTIDHLVSVAVHTSSGKEWLRAFDVLIIDEFSNTSTKSLAWLFAFLPNLVRIVFVGDHEQIGSISAGDAMGDIKRAFEAQGHAFRLTKIMRVQPELEDLYTAPKLMSQSLHRQLKWNDDGPLTLLNPKVPLHNVLDYIFKQKRSLMCQQIIVLRNKVRNELNEACQNLCIAKGMIKANHKKSYVIGKRHYYVGSKITFLENYNKRSFYDTRLKKMVKKFTPEEEKRIIKSEVVCNGETGIITDIRLFGHMYCITFVDTDDPTVRSKDRVSKTVLVSAQGGGIKPFHMDLGYATTTTKVQGREFEYAIFWNDENPAPCWTRAHAYVALSRGKKHVWCVSTAGALYAICDRPNRVRETILSKLLGVCREALDSSKTLSVMGLFTAHKWSILHSAVACVPTKEEFALKEKPENEEESEEI